MKRLGLGVMLAMSVVAGVAAAGDAKFDCLKKGKDAQGKFELHVHAKETASKTEVRMKSEGFDDFEAQVQLDRHATVGEFHVVYADRPAVYLYFPTNGRDLEPGEYVEVWFNAVLPDERAKHDRKPIPGAVIGEGRRRINERLSCKVF